MEQNVEIFGRKTFFIASDASLIPEAYLEEFLAHGYETYIIGDDYTCPLTKKVDDIIALYPGAILYFNIDATVEGIDDWKSYIADLRRRYSADALFGVLHAKTTPAANEKLRAYYEDTVGIRCGCIALTAHHHENFDVMEEELKRHGACGRRAAVRAVCDSSSAFTFTAEGEKYKAKILDVNLSSFACEFPEEAEKLIIYDKIRGASLKINGLKFDSDLVLLMKRTKNDVHMCIFMFIVPPDDEADLPQETKKALTKKIYQTVADETFVNLKKAFKKGR